MAKLFYRYAAVEKGEDDKSFQVRFSSEYPVTRTADADDESAGIANAGEQYLEILSHAAGDADFNQLNDRGAFLDEHDSKLHLGHVRKAVLSDDRCGRAIIEPDLATDLSKIRADQIRSQSRPHISVGYSRTGIVSKELMPDGKIAVRFKWRPDEISSVARPADPLAGANRAAETRETKAHCIHCGTGHERSQLDSDFICGDCRKKGRTKEPERTRAIDSPSPVERMDTITLTEAKKRSKDAVKDILNRNSEIATRVDEYIKDHGMKAAGKLGETLRAIGNEFCNRDSATPTKELLVELGNRCRGEIAKIKPEPYLMRSRMSEREVNRYSMIRGIASCIRRESPVPDGLEGEVHKDMEERAKRDFGGLGYESKGFHVPYDAPTPRIRSRRDRRAMSDRFSRDLYVGDFASGGALVPTELLTPYIELLRNRLALDWAGCSTLGGLQGNVIIPRQTGASAPQAVGEINALQATQQEFDQIELRPRRAGNTQAYSKQLLLQSTPDVEALIREDNFRQIAIKIDYMGLNGQGANSEPLGLMNTPGINSILFGGTPTYAQVVAMETAIRQNNVYDPIVFISTSTTRGRWRVLPAALVGATIVSGESNALWVGNDDNEFVAGRPAYDTQQVPNNQVIAGAFEHLLHAMWGGLDIIVDYITQAASGKIVITYNTWNDFALRHPQAFCCSADSGNQ